MTNLIKIFYCLCLLIFSNIALATVITLDFEGSGNYALLDDFYNGGTDSHGNAGENYGISFGSDALACVDADANDMLGGCNFANEPTNDTILFFTSGSAVLNMQSGFDTAFSFYYSASKAVNISVYSEQNLAGSLLGTVNLSANWQDNNCQGDPNGVFCHWGIGQIAFSGLAKSIDFGGAANYVGFDNITFGSVIPNPNPQPLPEPIMFALWTIPLLGLGWLRLKPNAKA